MREHATELGKKNARVVVVTFENSSLARGYVKDTALAWPLLIDETRELYKSYGMLSASFGDVWGPRSWIAYARELVKGQKLQKSEGDIYQQGGDVLIDPAGMVRLHLVGNGPADRPAVETILRIIGQA